MEYIIVQKQVRPFISSIALNRPKELNALNLQLMQEIKQSLIELDQDPDTRVSYYSW